MTVKETEMLKARAELVKAGFKFPEDGDRKSRSRSQKRKRGQRQRRRTSSSNSSYSSGSSGRASSRKNDLTTTLDISEEAKVNTHASMKMLKFIPWPCTKTGTGDPRVIKLPHDAARLFRNLIGEGRFDGIGIRTKHADTAKRPYMPWHDIVETIANVTTSHRLRPQDAMNMMFKSVTAQYQGEMKIQLDLNISYDLIWEEFQTKFQETLTHAQATQEIQRLHNNPGGINLSDLTSALWRCHNAVCHGRTQEQREAYMATGMRGSLLSVASSWCTPEAYRQIEIAEANKAEETKKKGVTGYFELQATIRDYVGLNYIFGDKEMATAEAQSKKNNQAHQKTKGRQPPAAPPPKVAAVSTSVNSISTASKPSAPPASEAGDSSQTSSRYPKKSKDPNEVNAININDVANGNRKRAVPSWFTDLVNSQAFNGRCLKCRCFDHQAVDCPRYKQMVQKDTCIHCAGHHHGKCQGVFTSDVE